MLRVKRGAGVDPQDLRQWGIEREGGKGGLSWQLGQLLQLVTAGGERGAKEEWSFTPLREGFLVTAKGEGGAGSFSLRASDYNGQYFKRVILEGFRGLSQQKYFELQFLVKSCKKN